jgi:hypothetical protein
MEKVACRLLGWIFRTCLQDSVEGGAIPLFRADLSVRSSVRMPLAEAVPGGMLLAAAMISPVQGLNGLLRNPPASYGKEKVNSSVVR